MRDKPLVETVDVVIKKDGEEILATVPKATADRWPDLYVPAETPKGKQTAAAKRAKDTRNADPVPVTAAADLPVADTTTGTAGVTTEGATS